MNSFFDTVFSYLPSVGGAAVGSIVMVLATVMGHLFGPFEAPLECLCIIVAVDYITGVLAAYIDPNEWLDSKKGFKGIARKVVLFSLVVVAHYCDGLLGGGDGIRNMVCWFFIGNEGISVLENANKAGLPIPKKLKDSLITISNYTKDKGEK